jgi:hypothetical protein
VIWLLAIGIVGWVVALHASPLTWFHKQCGLCQCFWSALFTFGPLCWAGKVGLLEACGAIGVTTLVAALVAIFTPLFTAAESPAAPAEPRAHDWTS